MSHYALSFVIEDVQVKTTRAMQDRQHFDTEMLYKELFTPLYRYLFLRTRDPDVANDLTQSCFLKYLLQENHPKEKDHALRLLFVIARTKLIDHWRTASKRVHDSLDTLGDTEGDLLNPEEHAIKSEEEAFIRKALLVLSKDEHDIVSLRISTDLNYDAIANITGVSTQNARKIYSRAIAKVGMAFEKLTQ